MEEENYYMSRAIELAKSGWGKTNPNPLVGAVIVRNGSIIGEGYHKKIGSYHAEIEALQSLKQDPKGSEIYVNLEPCSHFGKTPPCADALVKAGIKKVVIGMVDPNPLVSGKGISILKKAGIEVVTGVMEKECRILNEIFIKYITQKMPFVILKSAMTLDGKIATRSGDSKWITNEKSREFVHRLRDRVSAIMVGIDTVLMDNPSLTTRLQKSEGKDPVRIVIDSKGRIPLDAKVINNLSEAPAILVIAEELPKEKLSFLSNKNVKVITAGNKEGKVDLNKLMKELYKMQIDSILLEGGGNLNYSALESGIVDKILMFIAPKIIGGADAKTPFEGLGVEKMSDAFSLINYELKTFGKDILIEGYPSKDKESECSRES